MEGTLGVHREQTSAKLVAFCSLPEGSCLLIIVRVEAWRVGRKIFWTRYRQVKGHPCR